MPNKPKMTSSELGALWMTYQKKTLILRYLEYFIETAEDKKAQNLMSGLWKKLHPKVEELRTMIQAEGAVAPNGFTHEDVNLDAPRLYENGFDIMFCRVLKKLSLSMYALHITESYREDIIKLYMDISEPPPQIKDLEGASIDLDTADITQVTHHWYAAPDVS